MAALALVLAALGVACLLPATRALPLPAYLPTLAAVRAEHGFSQAQMRDAYAAVRRGRAGPPELRPVVSAVAAGLVGVGGGVHRRVPLASASFAVCGVLLMASAGLLVGDPPDGGLVWVFWAFIGLCAGLAAGTAYLLIGWPRHVGIRARQAARAVGAEPGA